MEPSKAEAWKREALDLLFQALAASKTLEGKVAYKGARVLALHLGGPYRASYDIDLNLIQSFVDEYPDQNAQAECLQHEITAALEQFVGAQNPVRYQCGSVKVTRQPRQGHPRGWDAFDVRVQLKDLQMAGVRGLPTLELDIAAPEELGIHALAPLTVGSGVINAYTMERIAGEKLRAFLSSLPAYRTKVGKPGEAVRAKDVYDLARILRIRPITDREFWQVAGDEFRLACASRFIDCDGIASFEENLEVTKATYEQDSIIPKDISFDDAWCDLRSVIGLFKSWQLVPFKNPLP